MAAGREEQSNGEEQDQSISIDGTEPTRGLVLIEEAAVLNCYPFMLHSHFNNQMGNQIGLCSISNRLQNSDLNHLRCIYCFNLMIVFLSAFVVCSRAK
jgi:hypothetical protein